MKYITKKSLSALTVTGLLTTLTVAPAVATEPNHSTNLSETIVSPPIIKANAIFGAYDFFEEKTSLSVQAELHGQIHTFKGSVTEWNFIPLTGASGGGIETEDADRLFEETTRIHVTGATFVGGNVIIEFQNEQYDILGTFKGLPVVFGDSEGFGIGSWS